MFATTEELGEIVLLLHALNSASLRSVSIDDAPVHDSNGELIGRIGTRGGEYVLITTLEDED